MLLITIINQRVQSTDTFCDNITALAAITTIRAASGHICLASEAHSPGAAIARFDKDFGLIQKFHTICLYLPLLIDTKKGAPFCVCGTPLPLRLFGCVYSGYSGVSSGPEIRPRSQAVGGAYSAASLPMTDTNILPPLFWRNLT